MNISHQTIIAAASRTIEIANRCANSSRESAAEARRIYGNLNNGGLWRERQAAARKVMRLAAQHGLTIERPYLVRGRHVYGIVGTELAPLF